MRPSYSEFINLVYSTPTFTLRTPQAFLAFYSTILPQRSNLITHLNLKFTLRFGDALYSPTALLNYALIRSQSHTRNSLPRLSLKEYPSFWSTTCKMMERMQGLKKLTVSIRPEVLQWSTNGMLVYWLMPLKSRGVEMDVRVEASEGKIWRWKDDEDELTWMSNDGKIVRNVERLGT